MYLPPIGFRIIVAFLPVFVNTFHIIFGSCQKCYNILMDTSATKPSKKLLLISLLIFALEYIGIVGSYWLFDGRAGDASLTISRYVGLNLWSSLLFCAGNMAIVVLSVYYLLTKAQGRGFIWRFLMYIFVGAFMALSISPHVPDESMPATIHRCFAGIMFVVMVLIGVTQMARAERKITLAYSMLFVIYAIFFCVCDAMRLDFFMNGIFWFESAYLFAFFGLILLPEERE